MPHSLTIADHIWAYAQQQAGPGKSPGHWLRIFLDEAILTQRQQGAVEQEPHKFGEVRPMYLGDYWMPRPLAHNGSNCNQCGDEFPVGSTVIAQHWQRDDGSKAVHYFHPWHVPAPGRAMERATE